MGSLCLPPEPSTPPCKLGEWLLELDDDDIATVRIVIVDRRTSYDAISEWLADSGVPMGSSTLKRHMRGRCPCADEVPFFGCRADG